MDQRHTFANDKELLSFVTSVFKEKMKAFLLIDREGLTRFEGVITSLEHRDRTENTTLTIDNRDRILLKEIIGINGVFRTDYSEC